MGRGNLLIGAIPLFILALCLVSFIRYPEKDITASAFAADFRYVALDIEPRAVILPESVIVPLRRITAYNPVPRQTDGDPNISSCGPNLPKQIALSRDLFFNERGVKHLCGTRVTLVTSSGMVFHNYVINDTMNARFSETADVMFPGTDEADAIRFGAQDGFLVFHGS